MQFTLSFKRFYILLALILFFVGMTVPVQSFAATLPAGFTETSVGGFSSPTAFAIHPDGRVFVTQQGGALRIIKNGALLTTPFVTVSTTATGERGLLGVAFDPNYAVNRFIYVYYTALSPTHNRVSRFTADPANEDIAIAGSELPILDLENLSATNHNGGAIHFGPDGKLYVAVGENAVSSNSQSINNRLGKMLRINSDGTIPDDNPTSFPGITGSPTGVNRAIWSVGLRNPFTFAFQPGTGRIHINDVGQNTWEEVDNGLAGVNYGWPTCEGAFLQGSSTPCTNPNFTNPVYTYSSSAGSECTVIGGAFYDPTNATFPATYHGKYFFGDLCAGWIKYIDPLNPPGVGGATSFATGISTLVDISVANDGSLYYLARGSSAVFRVQFTGNPTPTNTPTATNTATPTNTATATPTFTPTPLNCNTTLYASDTTGKLFTVNTNTGAAALVGQLPLTSTTEIEYDRINQRAFTQEGGVTFVGQEFDLSTGAAIGSPIPNAHTFTGLEWVGGTLYGASIDATNGNSSLRILNPWTGVSTLIGETGLGPISGLAYDEGTGTMYGITGGAGISGLAMIDLATGVATTIGSTGIDSAGSLEFAPNGLLYAGGGQSAAGNLYIINQITGSALLVGPTGFGNISGLVNFCAQSATPTATATATFTPTNTSTATNTPTRTSTNTPTPTFSPSADPSPTPTATDTPTNTPTATNTATPISTGTVPPTSTATPTPSPRSAFDYDGDRKTDISVFRQSEGAWYLAQSQAGIYGANFGLSSDKIAPADYDGDGKTDIAVYRPSTGIWYVLNSTDGTVTYHQFGLADDLPTPADYDGDGKADVSVFRPSDGNWYRKNSSNGIFIGIHFGASEDKPTVADFDGDRKSDIAVFRPSTGAWYRINSSDGSLFGENFGLDSDILTPADYDGDGKADLSVYRPSTGIWYTKTSFNSLYTHFIFGLANDIPAPADYDGDGHADICVFRPSDGTWYRNNSSNTQFIAIQFGTNGDKPTMTAFRY